MTAAPDLRESAAPGRAYWLCQLSGWGGYGLIYYLAVLIPFHAAGVPQIIADFAYCFGGFIGTHVLRRRMIAAAWLEMPLPSLLPRLSLSAALIAVLQAIALDGTLFIEHRFDLFPRGVAIGTFAATVFFSALLVGFWLAIYFVIHAVRRRRTAELDALRTQVLAREIKLRSLQQQLNPHFLFNCLNSVRGMIDEDSRRAQEMVTRLAELLRSSLRQDDCNAIPLDEELATVEAYLDLESVRLEERLRIRRDIEPATRSALVPPMLVQGLVENALKHGISRLPDGGDLGLRIAATGGRLHIEVRNTGTLNQSGSNGIGLTNARERLRLLYGSRAALSLTEDPPGTVNASVTLPLETLEAACAPSS